MPYIYKKKVIYIIYTYVMAEKQIFDFILDHWEIVSCVYFFTFQGLILREGQCVS